MCDFFLNFYSPRQNEKIRYEFSIWCSPDKGPHVRASDAVIKILWFDI